MDKSLAKAIFRRIGLPICPDRVFPGGTAVADACRETLAAFGDRVVVKPLRQGSAIGVTPVMNGGDLTKPFETAFALGDGVLVEPFVLGIEVTVGVLDLHGTSARPFPTIEVRTPRGTWYDYEHRYTVGQSEHVIPAPRQRPLSEPSAGDRAGGTCVARLRRPLACRFHRDGCRRDRAARGQYAAGHDADQPVIRTVRAPSVLRSMH